MPLLILGVIGLAVIIYFVWSKNREKKVLSSSEKIKDLVELNNSTKFNEIQSKFIFNKHYDNKTNFKKIEPAYIMSANLRDNIDYYAQYISLINDNREKKAVYQKQVDKIRTAEYQADYKSLKINKQTYKNIESKLFEKTVLRPVVDCSINVRMTYSSPKRKINLSKYQIFHFDDLFTSFESISRNHLDRDTYKALSLVERGKVSDSLRYDILNRDGFKCTICGASSKEGVRLHVDHIIPIAKGGKSTPDNLRTLCERCNIGKSDKLETEKISEPIHKTEYIEENANDAKKCPECGGNLILRKGKFGEFYGCSNYPNCKYTKQK